MPQIPDKLPKSLEDFTKKALVTNPIIQLAKNQTLASKSTEYSAKAQLLPSVELSVQNTRNYYNPQNPGASRTNNSNTMFKLQS